MLHFFPLLTDSPGIPPSATAHELFRGFSFVAPALLGEDNHVRNPILDNQIALKSVSSDQLLDNPGNRYNTVLQWMMCVRCDIYIQLMYFPEGDGALYYCTNCMLYD